MAPPHMISLESASDNSCQAHRRLISDENLYVYVLVFKRFEVMLWNFRRDLSLKIIYPRFL